MAGPCVFDSRFGERDVLWVENDVHARRADERGSGAPSVATGNIIRLGLVMNSPPRFMAVVGLKDHLW